MQIRDVMTSDLFCAKPTDKVSDIVSMMKRHNVGIIPVCENGRIIGLITDRDVAVECVAAGMDPQHAEVKQCMSTQPITVPPGTDLKEACEIMAREQVHRLPVVEGGRLTGIVSLGDIAVHCGDDKLVADTVRRISMPVRSLKMAAASE